MRDYEFGRATRIVGTLFILFLCVSYWSWFYLIWLLILWRKVQPVRTGAPTHYTQKNWRWVRDGS
ncbi:MAG: hypothetical protein ACYS0E_22080 [Planctomycetota bacterium]